MALNIKIAAETLGSTPHPHEITRSGCSHFGQKRHPAALNLGAAIE